MTPKQHDAATAMLQKFTADTEYALKHRYYTMLVGGEDGVKCALDGYRAAVVIPEDREAWNLDGAIVQGLRCAPAEELQKHNVVLDDAEKKKHIKTYGKLYFTETVTTDIGGLFKITKDQLEYLYWLSPQVIDGLLAAIRQRQVEYVEWKKSLPKLQRNIEPKYTTVGVNLDDKETGIDICAPYRKNIVLDDSVKGINFNAQYLSTALKFVRLARENVHVYYSSPTLPMIFHTETLYAMVLPVRPL